MKNSLHHKTKEKSFSWIKQNLDPLWSYIIFENDLKKTGTSIFDPDHIAYTCLEKEKYLWQQVIDRDLSREYLMIRIETGHEEQILGKVMGYGFPDGIVYYLYKADEV